MSLVDDRYKQIDRAAPFIDALWAGVGWKPSEIWRIGYCALATSRRPESAEKWLDEQLDYARQAFREGRL